MSPNTPVSPMCQILKPFSSSMMKPTGSPPGCVSSLPVAGLRQTYTEECSARVTVTLMPGAGVTLPLLLKRGSCAPRQHAERRERHVQVARRP